MAELDPETLRWCADQIEVRSKQLQQHAFDLRATIRRKHVTGDNLVEHEKIERGLSVSARTLTGFVLSFRNRASRAEKATPPPADLS